MAARGGLLDHRVALPAEPRARARARLAEAPAERVVHVPDAPAVAAQRLDQAIVVVVGVAPRARGLRRLPRREAAARVPRQRGVPEPDRSAAARHAEVAVGRDRDAEGRVAARLGGVQAADLEGTAHHVELELALSTAAVGDLGERPLLGPLVGPLANHGVARQHGDLLRHPQRVALREDRARTAHAAASGLVAGLVVLEGDLVGAARGAELDLLRPPVDLGAPRRHAPAGVEGPVHDLAERVVLVVDRELPPTGALHLAHDLGALVAEELHGGRAVRRAAKLAVIVQLEGLLLSVRVLALHDAAGPVAVEPHGRAVAALDEKHAAERVELVFRHSLGEAHLADETAALVVVEAAPLGGGVLDPPQSKEGVIAHAPPRPIGRRGLDERVGDVATGRAAAASVLGEDEPAERVVAARRLLPGRSDHLHELAARAVPELVLAPVRRLEAHGQAEKVPRVLPDSALRRRELGDVAVRVVADLVGRPRRPDDRLLEAVLVPLRLMLAAELVDDLDDLPAGQALLHPTAAGEADLVHLRLGVVAATEPVARRPGVAGDSARLPHLPDLAQAAHGDAQQTTRSIVAIQVIDAARVEVALHEAERVAPVAVHVPERVGDCRLVRIRTVRQARMVDAARAAPLGIAEERQHVSTRHVAPRLDAKALPFVVRIHEVPHHAVGAALGDEIVILVVFVARLHAAGVDHRDELAPVVQLVRDEVLPVLAPGGVGDGGLPPPPQSLFRAARVATHGVRDRDDLAVFPLDLGDVAVLVPQLREEKPVARAARLGAEHAREAVCGVDDHLVPGAPHAAPIRQLDGLLAGGQRHHRLAPFVVDERELLPLGASGPVERVRPAEAHAAVALDRRRRVAPRELHDEEPEQGEIGDRPGEHRAGDHVDRVACGGLPLCTGGAGRARRRRAAVAPTASASAVRRARRARAGRAARAAAGPTSASASAARAARRAADPRDGVLVHEAGRQRDARHSELDEDDRRAHDREARAGRVEAHDLLQRPGLVAVAVLGAAPHRQHLRTVDLRAKTLVDHALAHARHRGVRDRQRRRRCGRQTNTHGEAGHRVAALLRDHIHHARGDAAHSCASCRAPAPEKTPVS